MKAPKCRLCHHEHGHSEPHVWNDDASVKSVESNATNATNDVRTDELNGRIIWLESVIVGLRAEISRLTDENARLVEESKPFDKSAYQREYMREYMRGKRAKEKAA